MQQVLELLSDGKHPFTCLEGCEVIKIAIKSVGNDRYEFQNYHNNTPHFAAESFEQLLRTAWDHGCLFIIPTPTDTMDENGKFMAHVTTMHKEMETIKKNYFNLLENFRNTKRMLAEVVKRK